MLADFIPFLPPPLRSLSWRAHPQDGKRLYLLLRFTGVNLRDGVD